LQLRDLHALYLQMQWQLQRRLGRVLALVLLEKGHVEASLGRGWRTCCNLAGMPGSARASGSTDALCGGCGRLDRDKAAIDVREPSLLHSHAARVALCGEENEVGGCKHGHDAQRNESQVHCVVTQGKETGWWRTYECLWAERRPAPQRSGHAAAVCAAAVGRHHGPCVCSRVLRRYQAAFGRGCMCSVWSQDGGTRTPTAGEGQGAEGEDGGYG
jgi:hypothetical protein